MSIKMKELPELERPYEKLEWYGEKALSNAELLAIIIKTGTKEETSVQLAQKILKLNSKKEEGMNFLRNVSIEELMKLKGIGKVKAIQLKAVGELANRMATPTSYKKITIKNPNDLAKIMIEELGYESKEIVKIVMLSSKNKIVKIKDIGLGSADFALITVKDILGEAIKIGAPKVILVHNHPSGDAKPSKQDIEFTTKMYNAATLLGIQVVDHLVIGNNSYTSIFSEMVEDEIAKKRE